jgi:hypothetical protein
MIRMYGNVPAIKHLSCAIDLFNSYPRDESNHFEKFDNVSAVAHF